MPEVRLPLPDARRPAQRDDERVEERSKSGYVFISFVCASSILMLFSFLLFARYFPSFLLFVRDAETYDHCGTICIQYNFPSGTQTAIHPHPGEEYRGDGRSCYLPNNKEGRAALRMLKRVRVAAAARARLF
jgi:hypothetical protein